MSTDSKSRSSIPMTMLPSRNDQDVFVDRRALNGEARLERLARVAIVREARLPDRAADHLLAAGCTAEVLAAVEVGDDLLVAGLHIREGREPFVDHGDVAIVLELDARVRGLLDALRGFEDAREATEPVAPDEL